MKEQKQKYTPFEYVISLLNPGLSQQEIIQHASYLQTKCQKNMEQVKGFLADFFNPCVDILSQSDETAMKRRQFLKQSAKVAGALTALAYLPGCGGGGGGTTGGTGGGTPGTPSLIYVVSDYAQTPIIPGTDGAYNVGPASGAIGAGNEGIVHLLTNGSYVPAGARLSLITTPDNNNNVFYTDPTAINGIINSNNIIKISYTRPCDSIVRLEMQTDGGTNNPDYQQTAVIRVFGVQLPPNFQDIVQNNAVNIANLIDTPSAYGFDVEQLENILEGNLQDMSADQRLQAAAFRAAAPTELQNYLLNTLRNGNLDDLLFDRASKVYHDASTKTLWVPAQSDGKELSVAAPAGIPYVFLQYLIPNDAANDSLYLWNHSS